MMLKPLLGPSQKDMKGKIFLCPILNHTEAYDCAPADRQGMLGKHKSINVTLALTNCACLTS